MRRQNDIVAFKLQGQQPVAFHARNLEVAEISEDLWTEMDGSTSVSELREALTSWETESNPEVKSGKVKFGVRSLTINVTQICNLKCTYCAAGGDGTYGMAQTKISVEQTLPQLKFFLEKLSSGDSFKIVFLGGEPLLYPEGIRAIANYVQLMTAGRNITPQFSIVTNGTLMTDANIELLKSIKCNVTVSVDGPEHINDIVRPMKNGKGSTAAVIEGLHNLFAHKSSLGFLTLHGVFNETNMNLVEAYEFYLQFPADRYEFTYGVSETDDKANALFIKQMNLLAQKAYRLGGETALRQIGFFNGIFAALDEQQQTENFCGAGKSFLVVDARNNLFTCPWSVGKKEEQVGQGAQLNSEALEQYAAPLIEKNNCQSCWARYLCGGGCMFIHNQSENKQKKNKEFCTRMQSMISTAILYYKTSREAC
ncbi:Anaerobic sulfatase-maturating enzyme [compost metagenome]